MNSRTSIRHRIERTLAASAGALLLMAVVALSLSRAPVTRAVEQDDARGFWIDTFSDVLGISSLLSTTVDMAREQVMLSPLPVYSQTSWSGGAGLSTTTTTTDRYQAGDGVDVTGEGMLRLGNTVRAGNGGSDVNGDGYPDLVFSNYYSGTWGSGTYTTPSYVYYGSANGYTVANRLDLLTHGTSSNLVADLNEDGYLDLAFCEHESDSHVYWGSAGGYTTTNRSALSVRNDVGCSAADLDADGYLDLVLSVVYTGTGYPDYDFYADSYIYWGSDGGYSETNRTPLPTVGALSSYVVDLDQDGHLDIIFSNYMSDITRLYAPATYEIDSYVYWGTGERDGYTSTNRLELPTIGAHGSSVADLNGDGFLDIAFSNRHTADGVTYTYQVSSYIYWGGPSGEYTVTQRTELPTMGAYGNAIADLDQDGYWDIVFSNHQSGPMTHTVDSYIYWGSASGYTVTRRTDLPTVGAAGATVGDMDRDGYLDIAFSSRRNRNDHNVDSYVYWGDGSRAGYTVTQRTSLPTQGAIGNSAVGSPIVCANTSFGNIYAQPITGATSLTDSMATPSIYPPTGVLTSSTFDGGSPHRWHKVMWNAALSAGTDITIEVSVSANGSSWSSWQTVGSGSVSGTNEVPLNLPLARYLRYRVTLQSSADHRTTPTLYDVTFWGDYAATGSVTSVPVTPAALSAWDLVSWTAAISPGQAMMVQVLDGSGALLPDSVLPGNSAGFSASPVNILALDPSTYPSLRLRAVLSTSDVTTSPALNDWTISWFASPASVTIAPASSVISAGNDIAYTATAYDGYGKQWDVSQEASFEIAPQAGGTWTTNVYTAEFAGDWVVTCTYQSQVVTAALTVTPAPLDGVDLTPDTAQRAAGQSIAYTLTAFDQYDNMWDVTASGEYTIAPQAGGLWAGSVYTTEKDATWMVTATYNNVADASVLTVSNVIPTAIISGVTAAGEGDLLNFYAGLSYDPGNDIVSYAWDFGYTGSFMTETTGITAAHTYTQDGSYVLALRVLDDNGASDVATTTLTLANLPPSAEAGGPYSGVAGTPIDFSAAGSSDPGSDLLTYEWDWDNDGTYDSLTTSLTIPYSWNTAQVYTVSLRVTDGDGGEDTDTALVTVTPGAVDHIALIPADASIPMFEVITYTVQTRDAYDNLVSDVTASSSFTIEAGAGGLWTGNVYQTEFKGDWVVTATYQTMEANTMLYVQQPNQLIYLPLISR